MGSRPSKKTIEIKEVFKPFFEKIFNKKYKYDDIINLLDNYDIRSLIYIRQVLLNYTTLTYNIKPVIFTRLTNILNHISRSIDAYYEYHNQFDFLVNDIEIPPAYN